MSDELEQLNFNETLSDFASLINERGAREVATHFESSFPGPFSEFLFAGFAAQRAKKIARLFQP